MASNRPTILLVEDEAMLLVSLEIELSEAGFEVITASNGKLALDHLDDENTAIVGVVTDIRLGAGPDGWSIARHSRHVTPAMAVVYMSGDSSSDWGAEGVPDSIMLSKPFAFVQLATALSNLLNSASSGD